jgi:PHS family inorganic phosphate transporter-like MFS transporter
VYGIALMIMVFGSLGCGFSVCTTKGCVLVSLRLFRFLLGLGIGGRAFANKMTRGAFIAAVFSMQGFGMLAASTVKIMVCKIFERASLGLPKDPTTNIF